MNERVYMKNYIVSEIELRELVNSKELFDSNYPGDVVQDFLKSKKPIDQHGIDSYLYHEAKKHDIYTNENINVYVEVIK
jgi:hypothetical protein